MKKILPWIIVSFLFLFSLFFYFSVTQVENVISTRIVDLITANCWKTISVHSTVVNEIRWKPLYSILDCEKSAKHLLKKLLCYVSLQQQQNTAGLFYLSWLYAWVYEVRVKLQLRISLLFFLLLLFSHCSNQHAENVDNHVSSKSAESSFVILEEYSMFAFTVTSKLMEPWWIERKEWIKRGKGALLGMYISVLA